MIIQIAVAILIAFLVDRINDFIISKVSAIDPTLLEIILLVIEIIVFMYYFRLVLN